MSKGKATVIGLAKHRSIVAGLETANSRLSSRIQADCAALRRYGETTKELTDENRTLMVRNIELKNQLEVSAAREGGPVFRWVGIGVLLGFIGSVVGVVCLLQFVLP